jgi:hypothetical protein
VNRSNKLRVVVAANYDYERRLSALVSCPKSSAGLGTLRLRVRRVLNIEEAHEFSSGSTDDPTTVDADGLTGDVARGLIA